MAIDAFVANLYNSTPAAVTGKFINNVQGGTGQLFADLVEYNTNDLTGISLTVDRLMTANNSGIASSTPTSDIATAINTQGAYTPDMGALGVVLFTFANLPTSIQTFSLRVHTATTFSGQTNTRINANGSELTGAGTTDDSYVEFTGLTPDGSNQLVVELEDLEVSNGYQLFINGFDVFDVVETSGVTGTIVETLGATTSVASGVALVPLIPVTGTIVETLGAIDSSSAGAVGSSFVDDTFDGTAALGAHWSTYNGGVVPDTQKRGGYFDGLIDSNDNPVNKTLWFHASKGRLDYQRIEIPSGAPVSIVALNLGIGPAATPQDNFPHNNESAMLGVLVAHQDNGDALATGDWEFIGVGHINGAGGLSATVEAKSTVSDVSTVDWHGHNTLGLGVTHGDFKIEVHNTGFLQMYYRAVGDTVWIPSGGDGDTPNPVNYGSPGDTLAVGIAGYAYFSEAELPFRVTANSIAVEAAPDPVTGTIVSALAGVLSSASGVITYPSITGTISVILDPVRMQALGGQPGINTILPYAMRQMARRVLFHSTLIQAEKGKQEQVLMNAAQVSLGGASLTAPVDGVTPDAGYPGTQTIDEFNKRVTKALLTSNSIDVADVIRATLLGDGWTA